MYLVPSSPFQVLINDILKVVEGTVEEGDKTSSGLPFADDFEGMSGTPDGLQKKQIATATRTAPVSSIMPDRRTNVHRGDTTLNQGSGQYNSAQAKK